MKLTNKQLEILVNSIYKEHFEEVYKKERINFETQKTNVKLTKEEEEVIKTYVESVNQYRKLVKYHKNNFINIKDITRDVLTLKQNQISFNPVTPSKQQIEETIVLATINSKDINDLIKAVKSKFKLK